ncbi:hypothetical protein M0812_29701 [Anaeramoeba flamelloides]|uniref:Calponin-homology (CH) domain-containing protein n=1 Tax=Anaeramoeba flamelloides TaxID=1746091 RepID=A0AAV7Y5Z0_9EUKA|nr:hypothetical protein M0812_29701 [Anaeramoeba flamelloides]
MNGVVFSFLEGCDSKTRLRQIQNQHQQSKRESKFLKKGSQVLEWVQIFLNEPKLTKEQVFNCNSLISLQLLNLISPTKKIEFRLTNSNEKQTKENLTFFLSSLQELGAKEESLFEISLMLSDSNLTVNSLMCALKFLINHFLLNGIKINKKKKIRTLFVTNNDLENFPKILNRFTKSQKEISKEQTLVVNNGLYQELKDTTSTSTSNSNSNSNNCSDSVLSENSPNSSSSPNKNSNSTRKGFDFSTLEKKQEEKELEKTLKKLKKLRKQKENNYLLLNDQSKKLDLQIEKYHALDLENDQAQKEDSDSNSSSGSSISRVSRINDRTRISRRQINLGESQSSALENFTNDLSSYDSKDHRILTKVSQNNVQVKTDLLGLGNFSEDSEESENNEKNENSEKKERENINNESGSESESRSRSGSGSGSESEGSKEKNELTGISDKENNEYINKNAKKKKKERKKKKKKKKKKRRIKKILNNKKQSKITHLDFPTVKTLLKKSMDKENNHIYMFNYKTNVSLNRLFEMNISKVYPINKDIYFEEKKIQKFAIKIASGKKINGKSESFFLINTFDKWKHVRKEKCLKLDMHTSGHILKSKGLKGQLTTKEMKHKIVRFNKKIEKANTISEKWARIGVSYHEIFIDNFCNGLFRKGKMLFTKRCLKIDICEVGTVWKCKWKENNKITIFLSKVNLKNLLLIKNKTKHSEIEKKILIQTQTIQQKRILTLLLLRYLKSQGKDSIIGRNPLTNETNHGSKNQNQNQMENQNKHHNKKKKNQKYNTTDSAMLHQILNQRKLKLDLDVLPPYIQPNKTEMKFLVTETQIQKQSLNRLTDGIDLQQRVWNNGQAIFLIHVLTPRIVSFESGFLIIQRKLIYYRTYSQRDKNYVIPQNQGLMIIPDKNNERVLQVVNKKREIKLVFVVKSNFQRMFILRTIYRFTQNEDGNDNDN